MLSRRCSSGKLPSSFITGMTTDIGPRAGPMSDAEPDSTMSADWSVAPISNCSVVMTVDVLVALTCRIDPPTNRRAAN
jgi:hypothetical protein